MSEVIDGFCRSYHDYNAISVKHRHSHRVALAQLEAACGGDLAGIDAAALRAWAEELIRAGLAPATVHNRMACVRPCIRWMWQTQLIDSDTYLALRDVRGPRGGRNHQPRPYKRAEITLMWRQLEESFPWAFGRDHSKTRGLVLLEKWKLGRCKWKRVQPYARRLQMEAIVHLALHGGLRMSEIYNLQLDHADFENVYVVVNGAKKNRAGESITRAVPFTAAMNDAVRDWLLFRELLRPAHQQMWLSLWREEHRLKPLRFGRFEMLMRRLGDGWEFHRLRHTYATEMLRAGMSLELLSRILGHKTPAQTLGYAELLRRDLVVGSQRAETAFTRALARPPAEE